MKYSKSFFTLKGYSATFMFSGQAGICRFISLNFIIILDQFPWCLPGIKTTPSLTSENLWKFYIFRIESSSPQRGTDTGHDVQGMLIKTWRVSFHEHLSMFFIKYLRI